MFTWLNKVGVKSSKGFELQRTGRFSAEYEEDHKKITINLEPGLLPGRKHCVITDAIEFSKWDDGTPIPKSKQEEIINNFTDAMEFQNMGVVIE